MKKEERDKIKKEIGYWSNNCGGCETCTQHFGGGVEPTYDMQTVWELIEDIENLESELRDIKYAEDMKE